MNLTDIATAELRKRGMPEKYVREFAELMFIGFTKDVVEKYGMHKWNEGCRAQLDLVKTAGVKLPNVPIAPFV